MATAILFQLLELIPNNRLSKNDISSNSTFLSRIYNVSIALFADCKRYLVLNYKTPKFLISIGACLLGIYILTPTIKRKLVGRGVGDLKHSKRPDKYTTGFTNTGNDCFANATVQSLVPLYRLKDYFEEIMHYPVPEDKHVHPMPLHVSLMHMLTKLETPIYSKLELSVWQLLRLLEEIHHGKISRNQHDAHELFQMLLETLEDEYNRFFSFISGLDEETRKHIATPPHFPFSSVVETRLRCMRCNCLSYPVTTPMMMMELSVPQSVSSAALEDIITSSQKEIIEEYSCLVCTVKNMLFLRNSHLKLTSAQKELLDVLNEKLNNLELKINDDIVEDPLYKGIILSNTQLQHKSLKSTVFKEMLFIQPPEIITIHLSRSIFLDSQTWRNSCNVKFQDTLQLKTDKHPFTKTYRLKSIIRHSGTHSSGHYECYRNKPQFCKTPDGMYINDAPNSSSPGSLNRNGISGKKKMKKLASVLNKPFWRISDTKVTEVSKESVLNDGKAAYMLVYENV